MAADTRFMRHHPLLASLVLGATLMDRAHAPEAVVTPAIAACGLNAGDFLEGEFAAMAEWRVRP